MKTASEIVNFCNNQNNKTDYSNGNGNAFVYYSHKLNGNFINMIKIKSAMAQDLARQLYYNEDDREINDLKTLFEFVAS